jgi:hypothetical protein
MLGKLYKSYSIMDYHRRQLDNLSVNDTLSGIRTEEILDAQLSRYRGKEFHHRVKNNFKKLQDALSEYNQSIVDLDNNMKNIMLKQELKIMQDDYQRYDKQEHLELLGDRQSYISKEFEHLCRTTIKNNTSAQFASLDVNPADGKFVREGLGSEPQYILASDDKIKNNVKDKFNEYYANRRLRFYNKLENIPQNQIGFATCINLFEYMPLEPIKEITRKVLNCLRPGGQFFITYNNCEERVSLELLENGLRSLSTKKLITDMLYGQGYDVIDNGSTNSGTWNWMMVKKPGTLETSRINTPTVTIVNKKLD